MAITTIQKGTVDTSAWTAVTTSGRGSRVLIRNLSPDTVLLRRSLDTDPNSEDGIQPGGTWEYYQSGVAWDMAPLFKGAVIVYLKAGAGNVDYSVEFS